MFFCKLVQIPFNFQVSPIFFFTQNSPNFYFLHFSPWVLKIAEWPFMRFYKFSPGCHASLPGPGVMFLLAQRHMWQPIKGHHCTVSEKKSHSRATSTNKFHILSLGSYRSKSQDSQKPQEHNEQFLQTLTQNQSQFRTVPQKASIQLLNSTQGIKMEANSYEFSSKFSEIHKNLHHWTGEAAIQTRARHRR